MSSMHPVGSPFVLLVDSDIDSREMYATAFADAGFDVIETATAEQALRRAPAMQPSVIITGLTLGPGLDGLQLCERLRTQDATRPIPVILLTGWTHADISMRAAAAGCSSVHMKPLAPGDLIAIVMRTLREAGVPGALHVRAGGEEMPAGLRPLEHASERTSL